MKFCIPIRGSPRKEQFRIYTIPSFTLIKINMKKILFLLLLISQQQSFAQKMKVKFKAPIDAEHPYDRYDYFSTTENLATDTAKCNITGIISLRNNENIRYLSFSIITPIAIHTTDSSTLGIHFTDGSGYQFRTRVSDQTYRPGEEISLYIYIDDESLNAIIAHQSDKIWLHGDDADYVFSIEKDYSDGLANMCQLLKRSDPKDLEDLPLFNP